jgi:hypothetical protein
MFFIAQTKHLDDGKPTHRINLPSDLRAQSHRPPEHEGQEKEARFSLKPSACHRAMMGQVMDRLIYKGTPSLPPLIDSVDRAIKNRLQKKRPIFTKEHEGDAERSDC